MKYRTIVADPPWRYASAMPRTNGSGVVGRAAFVDNQYETMTSGEILGLQGIRELAADEAHLYLWVTNPMLPLAFDVVEAWGFAYKTLLTWHKNTGAPGMGHYFRGDTEHVIFATRGSSPIDPALRVSNHFAAPRTGHSAKPERFYEIVERVSPEPRLELFARRRRVGWDVWGNQAPPESEARTQMHMGFDAA
jgi:N6-adenosine-specific RNA methylase IME4